LEEDAGKNVHDEGADGSHVDLNRAGTPLLEIVTEPDLFSSEEVDAYLKTLRDLFVYLDVCDGNMEQGSFRCEPNVSIRPQGQTKLGTKVELKNINSFRYAKDALDYEVSRQAEVLSDGGVVQQETRLWDVHKGQTAVMRSKEGAHDYRYFPDPDLLPVIIDPAWMEELRSTIPELPAAANQKIKLYLSRFNVYKIYFTIRDLEILHEKHFFYAPFKGSIVSADLRVGSNARTGTRLGEIINLETLEAEMPVPADDIRWIDRNKPVTLTSSEIEGAWTGTIRRIGKTIDTRTQTVQIYIAVDQSGDENLYDGVFLKATIPGKNIANACSVPREALYEQKFVYVIENERLSYRQVQVVRGQPDYVIVNGGLEDGELLVVEMLQGVAPGMLARPRQNCTEDKN